MLPHLARLVKLVHDACIMHYTVSHECVKRHKLSENVKLVHLAIVPDRQLVGQYKIPLFCLRMK